MKFPNGRSCSISMMSKPPLAVAWSGLISVLHNFDCGFAFNQIILVLIIIISA
jgi:hypothetical protein